MTVPVSNTLVFLDSNIFLYALLEQDSDKTEIANALIRDSTANIHLSSQVVIEVAANLLRKGKFSYDELTGFIRSSYEDFAVVDVGKEIMLDAVRLRQIYSLSYWDSLIVSAALASMATVLFSEDMHNGLVIDSRLTIVNPFI